MLASGVKVDGPAELSRAILAGRFGHGERVRVSARADGEGLELI